MKQWVLIAILAVSAAVLVYMSRNHCSVTCGSSREGMTAGLDVTSGLAMNRGPVYCHEGNLEGSSSPYCSSPGYVLW